MRPRTFLLPVAVLAGTATGAFPVPASADNAPALGDRPLDWQTVLVAGDNSVPAFDNGITALHNALTVRGVTDVVELRASDGLATAQSVGEAIEGIQPGPAEGCLVYITTHGTENGVLLTNDGYFTDEDLLSPGELTTMLDRGCGQAPTALIVSACHSGAFVTDSMSQPNRVVIAAARIDRTSFGCSDDYEFTFFDECMLGAIPDADDWSVLYDDVLACVDAKEAQLGFLPSLPQYFEGAAMGSVELPESVAHWLKEQT